jgi:hypothetical protein
MCKNLIHKHYSSYLPNDVNFSPNNSIYKQSTHEQIVEMTKSGKSKFVEMSKSGKSKSWRCSNDGKILKWVLPIAKHKETNEEEEYFGIGESRADQCDEYPWWWVT